MSDFRPTASWPILELRAQLLTQLRAFFAARDFLEVETPILSADIVVDRHLDPLETQLVVPGGTQRLFLQTSPEFALKRLLAAGGQRLYQITKAFRQGEIGPRHNPEFTIVEWYRVGDDYEAGMQLLSDVAECLLQRGQAERLSYRQAFLQYVGIDPLVDSVAQLQAAGRDRGLVPPESFTPDDRDAWLDWLLVELVEPQLGRGRPTILHDYPPSQAALAQVSQTDPPVAERCELYADGIELANGYHELLDPAALIERNRINNQLRLQDGKWALPEHSRLIDAMRAGLPPCMGVALGFDRIVMLVAGVATIQEAVAFPIDRA